jgi:hypothetical protein
MTEFFELLTRCAALGSTFFDERLKLECGGAAGFGIVLTFNPGLRGLLILCGSFLAGHYFAEQRLDAGTHFLVGKNHTHTKFTEILKERVGPCGTLSFFVGAIGC